MDLVELVGRAQRGDRDAFAELAAASIASLYNIAHLMLSDSDLAEDAVQDTLIAAWRDIRGLRDPRAFPSWLRRALVRTVYREAARARRQQRVPVRATFESAQPDPFGAIGDRDELERAFSRLTPEHRAVLVLRHHLGLTEGQVADALGVPPGTVKSRLNRALAALRAELDAEARRPLAASLESIR